MSFEKIKQSTLDILNRNYNMNLFSSSNRESLADKIASAVSGDDLPENKVIVDPIVVTKEEKPTELNSGDNKKVESTIKKDIKPHQPTKGRDIKKKKSATRSRKRHGLKNLKNKK